MGRMQDGIGRIYFIERRRATYTKVIGKCRGKTNTVIPAGTKVKDTQGNIYRSSNDGTITDHNVDKDGNSLEAAESYVEIEFTCLEEGAITCPAGTLTERYQVIPGWESITNEKDGIVGYNTESQAQFEQRRRQSVAGNSVNSVDSIMAALLNSVYDEKDEQGETIRKNIPSCIDAYVTENSTGDLVEKDNVSILPHSIYVCVAVSGESSGVSEANKQAIARAIWKKKPPGCDMTGDKTKAVKVIDDSKDDAGNALYSNPPTYDIVYSYAKKIDIIFDIRITRSPSAPKDAFDRIKTAVSKTFTGEDGSARPRIGTQIFASSFYPAIQNLGSWAVIVTLLIGRGNGNGSDVKMGIDEIPTLTMNSISVVFDD